MYLVCHVSDNVLQMCVVFCVCGDLFVYVYVQQISKMLNFLQKSKHELSILFLSKNYGFSFKLTYFKKIKQ